MSTSRRILVNTSAMTAASFWRVAVSFVLQLLVARRLDAAALGTFALMFAWLQIAQILCEAGLPAWMVRESAGHPERRRGMLYLVLRLQVALAFAVGLALIFVAWRVPTIMPPLSVVAVAMLSLPLYAALSAALALFESAEAFDKVFVVDVATNTLALILSAILLYAGYGVLALFVAVVICQGVSVVLAWYLVRKSRLTLAERYEAPPAWSAALHASRHYFTLSFADVLQQRADLLLLGALASPAVTGLYAAAVSIVRVLIKLVQAFWRALFPTLSRLYGANDQAVRDADEYLPRIDPPATYQRLQSLALRIVLVATIGAAVVTTPLAEMITSLLFGGDFTAAGTVLAILVWSAPLFAWEIAATTRLITERRPAHAVRVSIVHLVILAITLPVLAWQWSANGAALASILAAFGGSLAGAWYLRLWNDQATTGVLLRFTVCALVAAAFGNIAGNAGIWFDLSAPAIPVFSAFAALAAYAAALIALRLFSAGDLQRLRRAMQA